MTRRRSTWQPVTRACARADCPNIFLATAQRKRQLYCCRRCKDLVHLASVRSPYTKAHVERYLGQPARLARIALYASRVEQHLPLFPAGRRRSASED
jgi:hypothetical protein